MSEKFTNISCRTGETIWDAVERHKKAGNLPQDAYVASNDRTIGGKKPDGAIGQVTVRARESFWIRVAK